MNTEGPSKVYVYGAGGHGKVVADILRSMDGRYEVAGFLDDDDSRYGTTLGGLSIVGGGEWIRACAKAEDVAVVPAIGQNAARREVQERLERWGVRVVSAVHASACVSPSAIVEPGSVVMPLAAINADARIRRGAIVNTGAVVEHDVEIGAFAHVSPRAVLGGGARVGERAHVGIGATVLPLVSVGSGSILGGGAVAVREVPANVVAVGIPARVLRANP